MLIPVHDDNPRSVRPWASWVAIGIQLLATALCVTGLVETSWVSALGLPAHEANSFLRVLYVALVLYWLLQWGLHWVFADNVEDQLGSVRFAIAYLLAGGLGMLLQSLVEGGGAKGPLAAGSFAQAGIAFVVIAYVITFPRRGVTFWVLARAHYSRSFVSELHLPAWGAAGIWLLVQLLAVLLPITTAAPLAALGGAAGGLAAGAWLRARGRGDALDGLRLGGRPLVLPRPGKEIGRNARRRRTWSEPASTPSGRARGSVPRASSGRVTTIPAPGDRAAPARGAPAVGPGDTEAPHFLEPEPARAPAGDDPAGTGAGRCPEGSGGWAVVRTSADPIDIGQLGRLAIPFTGELLFEATRRLRNSRGLVARDLDRAGAEQLVARLEEAGVPARARPWSDTTVPAACAVHQVAWSETSVAFVTEDGRTHDYPWRRVRLVIAYQRGEQPPPRELLLDGTGGLASHVHLRAHPTFVTFIELFVGGDAGQPPLRLRLHPLRTRWPTQGGRRALAREVLRRRQTIAVDQGIEVLLGHGFWGFLRFESDRDLDQYVAWLLLTRLAADDASEGVSYLE